MPQKWWIALLTFGLFLLVVSFGRGDVEASPALQVEPTSPANPGGNATALPTFTPAPRENPTLAPPRNVTDFSSIDAVGPLPTNPEDMTDFVVTAGSPSVYVLLDRIVDDYEASGFEESIIIDVIGSGAGFERFCYSGETDIANSIRPLRDSEVEVCWANDRLDILAFYIGSNAIAVITSRENEFLTNVSFEELTMIFGEAVVWSDVRPSWPDEPIERFIPALDSGEFDFFLEEVFDMDEFPILSTEPLVSADDNVIVIGVAGSPYRVGFVNYEAALFAGEQVQMLSVEGVQPTQETIESADYPFSRPLYLYTTSTIMREKPTVADFLAHVINTSQHFAPTVGYVPVGDALQRENIARWQSVCRADAVLCR